ncbi:MAG: DUF4189 domain-containing protein [Pseudorhodoplanes sp.]
MSINLARAALAAALFFSILPPAQAAGALAVGECGAFGHAYDYPTLDAARAAALAQCEGRCKVVAVTRRGCLAYAIDSGNVCGAYGYASRPRLGRAQNEALKACFDYGGKTCVIRAFACDGKG